jgi:hypothetical protein
MRCGPKKAQLKAMRRRPDRDETSGYRSGLELELMRPSPPRGRSTCGYTAQFTQAGIQNPNIVGKPAPHSSEFRHYTPYPDQHRKNASPEATWAQPLSREELS